MMRIVFEAILIVVVVAMTVMFLRGGGAGVSAWKKIAAFFATGLAVVFIVMPQLADQIAKFFEIGSGTNLVLYGVIVVMIVQTISAYLRGSEEKRWRGKMVRKVSLLAKEVEELGKKGS